MNFGIINTYKNECGMYLIEDDILITDNSCCVFPGHVKSLNDIYMPKDLAMSQ